MMRFTFCPRCRAKLTETTSRHLACKKCGFDFYINPGPTASVIIENAKGEILLVKRKYAPRKGYWDIAGGFIEFRESAEDAARREIKEQLGIAISRLRYITSYPDLYKFKHFKYHTLTLLYVAQMPRQKIIPADDVSEAQFFSRSRIPWNQIAFEWMKPALREYVRRKTI